MNRYRIHEPTDRIIFHTIKMGSNWVCTANGPHPGLQVTVQNTYGRSPNRDIKVTSSLQKTSYFIKEPDFYGFYRLKAMDIGDRVVRSDTYIEKTMMLNPDFDRQKLSGPGTIKSINYELSEYYDDALINIIWDSGPMIADKEPHLYIPKELRQI